LIGFNQRTLFEKGMDNVHLNPFSLSVDNSDLLEAFLLTLEEIVLQERRDLFGRESMKIDPVLDGNLNYHKQNVKLPAHRAGLPEEEVSFILCP
jgi:hypothetical protein